MNDQELERLVRGVIAKLSVEGLPISDSSIIKAASDPARSTQNIEDALEDIGDINLREEYLVDSPHDASAFKEMKLHTPARLGVGHSGARYRTETMLRFQADHAAAQDAVFSDVPDDFLQKLSLKSYQTLCQSRQEFLTRPDRGRVFSPETLEAIRKTVPSDCRVLLYVSDGLSSSAVRANSGDILPVIREGLRGYGIGCNDPFFVKYGRVGTMDALGDVIPADVVCVLIGERPGLVTADSMSAYIAYRPRSGMPESRRTVLANIHSGGTPSVEAGAHIVDILRLILEKKVSGVELPA